MEVQSYSAHLGSFAVVAVGTLTGVFPLHWLNLLRDCWEKPQPELVLVYPENTCRSKTLGRGDQETILVQGRRTGVEILEWKAELPAVSKEVRRLVCTLQAFGRAVPSLLLWSS